MNKKRLFQAGAIPYSIDAGELKVMLVTSRDTGRWVIPKGGIDRGQTPAAAAEQEAYEEAGVVGDIAEEAAGRYDYVKRLSGGKKVPAVVEVFPLRVRHQLRHWPEKGQRRQTWVPAREAAAMVAEEGLAQLLLALEQMVAAE